MADNVSVTPGSGASIAADDVGGVLHQRVKISVGADGTAADMPATSAVEGTNGSVVLPAGLVAYDPDGGLYYNMRAGARDGETVSKILGAAPMLYNGSTVDRQRGNLEGTLLASAARTIGTASANQTNYNHRGVLLMVVVTSAGTGTITLQLFEANVSSQLCAGSALSGTGSLLYYPGALDADFTGDARSGALPRTWNAYVAKSDGSSWTYSLSYSLIL